MSEPSYSLGRTLCGHLKDEGRLNLAKIRLRWTADLAVLDKLCEDGYEVYCDHDKDAYIIKKGGTEVGRASLREEAITKLFESLKK